jgi:PAS domain S-box-containing protein
MNNPLKKNTLDYYRISISVLFGIVSYFLNTHPLMIHIGPHSIPTYAGLCLPVYIAIVWGWKYGLLSVFSGGYLPILFSWEPEGYGTLYLFTAYFLWVLWHGFWRDFSRESGDTFWTNTLVLEGIFRFFVIVGSLTIYPFLLSRNPPFWNPSAHILSFSSHFFIYRLILQTLLTFYSVIFLKLALTNPRIRSFFHLEALPSPKRSRYFFPAFILIIIFLWFLTAILRYFTVYSETVSFSNILFYQLYNNFFLQDIIILYILSSAFLFLSTYVQKTQLHSESYHHEMESKLQRLTGKSSLLENIVTIIKDLPELKETIQQCRYLSQSFGILPSLKNYWIIHLHSAPEKHEFLNPANRYEQRIILQYIESNEGQIRLKKLKKSGSVAVDPAVIVNQPELFPNIYHVLISAYIDFPEGAFLLGFIVEEDLWITRIYTEFLKIIISILTCTGITPSVQTNTSTTTHRDLSRIIQTFYSRLPGYWMIINHSGHIKAVSEDFLHFSGYTRQDLIGTDSKRVLGFSEQNDRKQTAETPAEAFLIQKNGSRTPIIITRTTFSSRLSSDILFHILDNLSNHLKEKALEDREFRYRSYFNNMSDASFVIDRTTRIIDVNQTACLLFKYTRNEMIGLKVADIVSDDEIPKIDYHMQDIFKNQVSRFESVHVTKNGHRIMTEVHARRFSERKHELIHVVLRNIGERKEQERTLQRFYETATTIGAKGRSMLIGFTEKGLIRYANPLACIMSGFSEQTLREKSFFELFISPDQQRQVKEFLENLHMKNQDYGRRILPFRTRDGEEKTIIWDFSHIRRDRHYNLFFTIGTDITDLYKEHDQIRRERDNYKSYIDRSPIPFCILNPQGKILDFNPGMGELLQTGYHELKLQSLKIFMDSTDYNRIISWIENNASWQSAREKAHLKRPDGTPVPVLLFLTILNESEILLYAMEIPDKEL